MMFSSEIQVFVHLHYACSSHDVFRPTLDVMIACWLLRLIGFTDTSFYGLWWPLPLALTLIQHESQSYNDLDRPLSKVLLMGSLDLTKNNVTQLKNNVILILQL